MFQVYGAGVRRALLIEVRHYAGQFAIETLIFCRSRRTTDSNSVTRLSTLPVMRRNNDLEAVLRLIDSGEIDTVSRDIERGKVHEDFT
jgi:hypothetical protein